MLYFVHFIVTLESAYNRFIRSYLWWIKCREKKSKRRKKKIMIRTREEKNNRIKRKEKKERDALKRRDTE